MLTESPQSVNGKSHFCSYLCPTSSWEISLWPRTRLHHGNVEKSRQRRSRLFAVLTYSMYAPRVKQRLPPSGFGKQWQPCWTDFFEHSLQLMLAVSSWACICQGSEIFNSFLLKRPVLRKTYNTGIDLGRIFTFSEIMDLLLMAEDQQADVTLHPEVNLAGKNRR